MKITNCQKLCLTELTSRALIVTLNSTASLIEDLLSEGYKFVLTSRFQSDPIERRFSRYRQMSGGRFLVGLREVQSSEKILKIKSLLKAGLDFWKLNLTPDKLVESDIDSIISPLLNDVDECHLDENSTEVAVHVAGYITKNCYKLPVIVRSVTRSYQALTQITYNIWRVCREVGFLFHRTLCLSMFANVLLFLTA